MSGQNEQQIAEALRAAPPIILAPGPKEPPTQLPPVPDDVWALPGGTAWVYYGERNRALTAPVIMADGFNTGPSTPEFSWNALEFGGYPLLSELRRRGKDVVLLGFTERSASILDNAEAAIAAIREAIARRQGSHPLTVGGFSMGGLVTRYALAKMESRARAGDSHQTALYFSYDSPHRGAWVPIALLAFAHYIRKLDSRFSDQMNSRAARQLLWQHIAGWQDEPDTDEERKEFVAALERVGNWPRMPRLIGVANGVGSGQGNGIAPGQTALRGTGAAVSGTDLRSQSTGDDSLVATLRVVTSQRPEIRTMDMPDIDSAPGGMLEGFGILADALNKFTGLGLGVDNPIRSHCFVPAVSAVAIRDIATNDDLYVNIHSLPPDASELDEFKLASQNEGHTAITEELCTWIMERLP
ncbi:hypothetical protein [Microbispora sp. NPDC049633]|uniref:hypothetical protein n=1 Tax=Microbispora sp. NPDC049633 TaxID=3154355 RepID=UPI00344360C7